MPYFVADHYENDLGALPNYAALAADSRVVGCIAKATQGISYAPAWFVTNWPRIRAAAGSRYGDTFFRGCYHFADPYSPGAMQADFCLAHVERAGGWAAGDMPLYYDLEGSAWSSSQQIIDVGSGFAARVKARTGRAPVLYTGATVRDRAITDHMGFDGIWTPHLDMSAAAWPLSSYRMWQYAGDGALYNPATAAYGFPTAIAGWGGTDMNVVMSGGAFASSLAAVRRALLGCLDLMTLLLLGGAALVAYHLYLRTT